MMIALAAFLIIFSIFLHELGHALYMRKYGIPIETFSIGLPFPIKIRFSSKRICDGATLQATPFLLGAYVKPTEAGEERMIELPYKKQADIYGAGPLANFLFTGILMLAWVILESEVGLLHALLNYKLFILAGPIAILFLCRELFSRYLMIPLGTTMVGLIAWSIAKAPTESVAGPVGIAKMVGEAVDLPTAFMTAALLSLVIGLFNTLPVMPLDGGRTMDAFIGQYGKGRLRSLYRGLTASLLFLLIGLAFFSDCAG